MGVHFGTHEMARAIMLYSAFTVSTTRLAPVHHISEPYSSFGTVAVQAMWCRAPGKDPLCLVRLQSVPSGTLVAEEAAAAWDLNLNLLSIHTPSDITLSVGVVWWSNSLIPTV